MNKNRIKEGKDVVDIKVFFNKNLNSAQSIHFIFNTHIKQNCIFDKI